jgi:hypothetical protein
MKTCKICNNKHCARGYCKKHYYQLYNHGKLLQRTRFDPNEFVQVSKNVTEVIMYDKNCKETARAIVDTDMVPEIKKHKWYLATAGYAVTDTEKKMFLHHFVIGHPEKPYEVDHINRNRLDNRKVNLRFVTSTQNNINMGLSCKNTSGYKGIGWCKKNQKWRVRIKIHRNEIHLGYFANKNDAIAARKQAEDKYFRMV